MLSRRRAAAPCAAARPDGAARASRQRMAISRLATAFFAGHRGRPAAADGVDEGEQLGAQRLGIADRQMPHRVAAVRLEAETFGDLQRQQIADEIFVARGDVDVARLERRQPVGVDVGEHAGGGAELQQRDVLALGDRARQLRLDFDDFRIREPADQVDVVHREIDDHADVRHARRKRTDAGDGDREDVLVLDRALDRLDRRIEALDVTDHERDAGAAGGGDDSAALLHRRSDRLLDHDVDAAGDAFERQIVMQMGRRRDGDRIDPGAEQSVGIAECGAAERPGDEIALLAVGIGDPHQLDTGNVRQNARMVAAHDADANNPDLQRAARANSVPSPMTQRAPLNAVTPIPPLACPEPTGDPIRKGARTRFASKTYGRSRRDSESSRLQKIAAENVARRRRRR